jgi:uroporphyrinogen III methyltransferase / synthase
MTGHVHLVGAGPGDPGLLTLRAADVIGAAEFIAIDALVSDAIAAMIPETAEVVYVGKRSGNHALPQKDINALLIAKAREGKRVIRLKGGDPFVFGRGGEEAQDLIDAGIPVQIVPGISSAIAGPAYAGIPVTHRDHATSVTLVTGHESGDSTGVNWKALAQLDGTIVFMMGLGNLPLIAANLITHGMTRERSVAVISNATRPDQRTVVATLETVERVAREANMTAPALIVVGEVTTLHETLRWSGAEVVVHR